MEKSSPATGNHDKKREKPVKLRKKISASYLENAGAFYLQRFAASTGRFRQVMVRKIDLSCRDHPEQDRDVCLSLLDELIVKFSALGYLNDLSYARGLYYSLSQRGWSRQKIMASMRTKGVAADHIQDCFGNDRQEDELVLALRYVRRRKFGSFALYPEDGKNRQRALASLARNGFSYDTASRALSMDREEALTFLENL